MIGLRKALYRAVVGLGIGKQVLYPRMFSEKRWKSGKESWIRLVGTAPSVRPNQRVWFHAASVGEFESLWPVILSWANQQGELIVTVFSESAESHLERLRNLLASKAAKLVYSGYSPLEGDWAEAIKRLRPQAFVTAKYEAWPDLWMSLAEEGIPLIIVGARARRSLLTCRRICRGLGAVIPSLVLLPALDEDEAGLREMFPESRLEKLGEPRWDQVFQRSRQGSPRAKALTTAFADLPRPWGVFGSVWLEDLKFWGSALETLPGTLWVVPHRVDSESVEKIETFLLEKGLNPLRTAIQGEGRPERCVLVDEMGFLSELYSAADWAFVGGGFGAGVHSTIEPAIHGIPVAIGPTGAEKFPEIQELESSGQLRILRSREDLVEWMKTGICLGQDARGTWIREAEDRQGATERVRHLIEQLIRPS